MARFSRQQVVSGMKEGRIVPLFTHDNPKDAQEVLEAAYDGGIRVFEFTNRRENSFEVFKHLLSVTKKYSDLMLGIGTILDGPTTKKFIDAGADFVISPIMKLEMAKVCRDHDISWIPGCATLTEIVTAKDNGAEIIKLFPGSVLGPGFVSSSNASSARVAVDDHWRCGTERKKYFIMVQGRCGMSGNGIAVVYKGNSGTKELGIT